MKNATLLVLLTALITLLGAGRVAAQSASLQVFEAPLMSHVDGQAFRKGTVLATLDGDALRLFGVFNGLRAPWIQADLYRGNPADGGEPVENILIFLHDPHALGGGFDRTLTLTPALLDDLHAGALYVRVMMATADPKEDLHGHIQLAPASEPAFLETPLSHLWLGTPVARGGLRAIPTSGGLRLMGYFHGLASNWQQIMLSRGAHGTPGTPVHTIWNLSGGGLYAGFDDTLALADGWQQDLADGLFSVEVSTSPASDGLRGQLYPTANQAPEASEMLSPAPGETIVIGGTQGGDPVDPDVYLGLISFAPAADPDGHPVGYRWQASLRPDFLSTEQTVTYDLGVDSTQIRLTVGTAAALFDALTGRQPGTILLETPTTIYHRVLTTDGSRYTVGEGVTATFVRGTVTAYEPTAEVPAAFALHGNYPNPFNPSTTITFDLPAQAEVRVEVFNLLGQRVLTVPAGFLAAGTAHRIELDGTRLPASGGYLYRLVAQHAGTTQTATGTLLLVK